MTDQPFCRCVPAPVRAAAAAAVPSRCPACGLLREPQAALAPPPAPAYPLEFNWSPARASAAGNDIPLITVRTEKLARNPTGKKSLPRPALQMERHGRPAGDQFPGRAVQSRQLQSKVCRFLGGAIILWSLFSLLPAGLAWHRWLNDFSATPLPVWLPANLVLGSLPILLGILLLQVAESAALRAVAGGLLAICSAYGFAASLFALAQTDSNLLAALSFPYSETKRATVWCLAMATLAGLISFSCFREGQRWQRIEELLSQLLPTGER